MTQDACCIFNAVEKDSIEKKNPAEAGFEFRKLRAHHQVRQTRFGP